MLSFRLYLDSATNSPYGGQDVNSTSSSGPLTTTSKDVNRHASSDDFRTLERKLEKERERRTHVDASPPRIDSKGMYLKRKEVFSDSNNIIL